MTDAPMTDKEFLASMSKIDSHLDHDVDVCGQCFHQFLMAEVARELLENDFYSINAWSEETKRRWEEGKFFKLWQEAIIQGLEPHDVFGDKGWIA